MTEAEVEVMLRRAKKSTGLEEAWKASPLEALEGTWP